MYGEPQYLPYDESHPLAPVNVYGRTKYFIEEIIRDWAKAGEVRKGILLRYFNPVGSHPSGRIGENPLGTPNNLLPFVSQAAIAVGRRPKLQVFDEDWPTIDGTGLRDYMHMINLSEGHRSGLGCLLEQAPQLVTLNLGSGQGASVLEVVQAFEHASGRTVPYNIAARRDGDAAITVADPTLALQRLGWRTQHTLDDICRDGWAWQSANPAGYGDPG